MLHEKAKSLGKALLFILLSIILLAFLSRPVLADEEGAESPEPAPTEETAEAAPESPPVQDEEAPVNEDPADSNQEPEEGKEEEPPAEDGKGSNPGSPPPNIGIEEKDGETSISIVTSENVLFSGAASSSFPILTPPGRGGVGPKLSLQYNSNRKGSWVGYGWSLNLGVIRRSTKHGLDYGGTAFVAESKGVVSELVPREEWGPHYFGSKIEEGFDRYYLNPSTHGWEVRTKDGTILYYGSTQESRQEDGSHLYSWYLDRVVSSNGNFLSVTYTSDHGQLYMAEILYTGRESLAPSHSIKFYMESRPDVEVRYDSHFKVKTAYRLKTIDILSNGERARTYSFTYSQSPSTSRSLLTGIRQFGSDAEVDETGGVISGTALPETRFTYQEDRLPEEQAFDFQRRLPGASVGENSYLYFRHRGWKCEWDDDDDDDWICETETWDHRGITLGDFNGDGRTDMFHLNPHWDKQYSWVALSDGDGTFTFNQSEVGASLDSNSYILWKHWLEAEWDEHDEEWNEDRKIYHYTAIHAGDFNGDGLTDMLHLHPNSYKQFSWVALSDGDGTFTFSQSEVGASIASNSYINRKYKRIHMGDFNGDGKTDMLHLHPHWDKQYSWVALSDGDGTFTFSQSKVGASVADRSYLSGSYRNIHLGDFNGDGKTDMLHLHPHWDEQYSWVALSKGDGTFEFMQSLPGASVDDNSYLSTSHRNIVMGDFNGDGLTDMAHLHPHSHEQYSWVALSKGDGHFEFMRSLPGASVGSNSYIDGTNNNIYGADINGDGLTDMVHLHPSSDAQYSWSALSNGDGTFTFTKSLPGASTGDNSYLNGTHKNIHLGDFDGDGKTDMLHLHPNSDEQYSWVALAKGEIPDLLTSVTNSMGGTTTIAYEPSTKYTNEDLPFVVQTLSSISTDDGLGNVSTTTFSYEGGLYERAEREFRGFKHVTRTHADGTALETWFHQSKYLKGRQYQTELKAPDNGPVLSKTTLTWELFPPNSTSSNPPRFVKLTQKRTEDYDGFTVFTQEDYTYDNTNGNLLTKVASGTDGETLTVTNQYQNFGNWLWRLTTETIEGNTSGKVRETYYGYETGTGNMLYKESWFDGGTSPRINMTYDVYGNPVTVTDARGNMTSTEYDPDTHTYPVKVTQPATAGVSHIVEYEAYDHRFGKATQIKDENGNRTHATLDAFGRTIAVDYPDGGRAVAVYHDHAFPAYKVASVKQADPAEYIDAYHYLDGLGRPIQTVTSGEKGKSIVTKTHYDEMGRESRVEGPFFGKGTGWPQTPTGDHPWVETTYDDRGRPVQVKSPHSVYGTVMTTLSYSGLSATTTDPDQSKKTQKKDYLGRIIEVIEHGGDGEPDLHTTYAYNGAGDLVKLTDAHGNVTTILYDTLGRKKSIDDPDMGYWQYTYDENGNLKTQTDAKGHVITYVYDELNRVTSKSYSTANPQVTYTYDNPAIPNGKGRLYSLSNTKVTTTYGGYDKMGRVTSLSKAITGDPTVYETRYDYNLSGKVTRLTYPDGFYVDHAYHHKTDLLHTLTGPNGEKYAQYTGYTAQGTMGKVAHGNGTSTTFTYDPLALNITGIETMVSGNAIQTRGYTYTPGGELKELETDITAVYTAMTPITYTFEQNTHSKNKHALATAVANGITYNFNHDQNGNTLSGPDFTDMNNIGTRRTTYNPDNMPTTIYCTGTRNMVRYDYDGDGVRAKKIVRQGGQITYYVGKHFEVSGAGEVTRYVFANAIRVAMIKGGHTYYFHKDHLGSTTALTDETGTVVERIEYLPFGAMAYHDGERIAKHLYTDQEWEAESGLYNYNARLYDPILGRFITPDSMVPDPYDPQALNRYVYVKNNPLKYIDPSGHWYFDPGHDSGSDYGWGRGGFDFGYYGWLDDYSFGNFSIYSSFDYYSYDFSQSYRFESETTAWTDVGNFFLSNPELFDRSGQWHVSYPETYNAPMRLCGESTWYERYQEAYNQYNPPHAQHYIKTQNRLENWYRNEMVETVILIQTTNNYPVAALEVAADTIVYSAGSTGNFLNYFGWSIIDDAHAAYSATFPGYKQGGGN